MKQIIIVGLTFAGLTVAIVASQSGNVPDTPRHSVLKRRAFGAIHPRISPDGRTIAFSYQGAIWRMPRTGGTMTRLTRGRGFDTEPTWSADGMRIAYLNTPGMGSGGLRLIDADTGGSLTPPNPPHVDGTVLYTKLCFHPDGRRILANIGGNGRLSWYDLESENVQQIVSLPNWSRYALSQDGRWIAYSVTTDAPDQQMGNFGPQVDLWKISAAGGTPTKLRQFPSRIHDLCWSADGGSLVVVTDLGGVHYDLWQVDLANGDVPPRKLTFGQADEERPSISRDGRWLVYSDNRQSCTSLVVRDMTTGVSETLSLDAIEFGEPTGTLRLQTRDAESGEAVVARLSVQRQNGKFQAPLGSLYRVLKDLGHFYCERETELTLPAGTYHLRAFRGPEYRATHRRIEVGAGQTVTQTLSLDRWAHAAKRGWYSGENHIHANYGYGHWYNTPETMLRQCAGENLNVCNFMVSNSDTDGVFDREFFRGQPDPRSTADTILYWNQEFRSTIWGHMTLLNLRQVVEPVFTGFKDTTNPWDIPTNADIADRTHLQNGLVNFTHVAQNPDDPYQNPYTGKEIPIDVALGKIDTLDINASYRGTVPLWHRLLNCGFRLPASAGTDCFLNRIRGRLPGGDRVYVKIDGPFTYPQWIEGLRAGRSFVTNGPMLELVVADSSLGETIRLSGPEEVHVSAQTTSQFPLAAMELIYNGRVVATGQLDDAKCSGTIEQTLKLDRGGWLMLRATGPGHADHPFDRQEAYTSPIYVELEGKPHRSRDDALFFLKWIDRLALAIRLRDRLPRPALREHVQEQFEAARNVYREIAASEG
jgi:WD40 repeat protein